MTVTLALAKQHLEYEASDRDTLIQSYIDAAKAHIEHHTGLLLTRRETVLRFEGFHRWIDLRVGPNPEVVSLKYVDSEGDEQTVATTDYRLIGNRLHPVTAFPHAPYGMAVTVEAGYDGGDNGTVPADIISAQLLLIGHWFANREAVALGTIATEVPLAVEALCRPHRLLLV